MGELAFRAAAPDDRPAILALLSASLGWGDDERFRSFYEWKHERNPFGRSPGLVAVDGDRIIGFRTFLRWEFVGPSGEIRRAVRAVDTATDPQYQGRGVFRALTLRAVDDLTAESVAFVFNTPNARSRPGYLSMGWVEVGRLRTSIRLCSPGSAFRMMRSRVPAARWSTDTSAGRAASEVLADPGLADLLRSIGRPARLHTNRTVEYLRWRYDFAPLSYRALTVSDRVADGLAIFRLRSRGRSLECALCELLVPDRDPGASQALLRAVAGTAGADYVIRIGGAVLDRAGYVRLPRQGPVLTWRPLADSTSAASLSDWSLCLGDVELF
ncbi:MAG: GNAT family N-acetyltransferase [Acidimicrobiia bacterium]|nr:GNAT family N-acetyltransferase [Acidimicrobiia bacterium]